ncbi:GRB10-interacting GYF protein 2-like [Mizuhopecten yessoensis]|uniref:DPY30 domain-containing protein 1 n=1 Tax=Mizuhopecten yessoensis TaxID=6573 RepID=A0A210QQL1_MIZYE|nr:GRB10-interacting GYF protein 2-like [Mizuhopecten yessoensis]OWF51037.1 DPY30 domain-containing protein 1 [Mizuhopecten yessoensis]
MQQQQQTSTNPAAIQKPYVAPTMGPRITAPPPATIDGKYAAEHLGGALTLALAEIATCRPNDPIEYLANWLYKYKANSDHHKQQLAEAKQLGEEEAEMIKAQQRKEKRLEEQRQMEEEAREKAEKEEEERRKREQEDLQRKAKEAALAQRPNLETLKEEEGEEDAERGREKDFTGQTELHRLASTPDSTLMSVLNMGYSLAERNGDNQTPRELAAEKGLQHHVDTIDEFVQSLVENEKFAELEKLLLDGYDQWEVVLQSVKAKEQSEGITKFIDSVPDFQEKMLGVLRAAQTGVVSELQQALEQRQIVTARDKYGRGPLHIAVLANQSDVVRYLATNFPETLKARDNMYRTPLHYTMALSEDLAQILTENGSNIKVKDAKLKVAAYYKENPSDIETLQSCLPQIVEEGQGQMETGQSEQDQGQQEME